MSHLSSPGHQFGPIMAGGERDIITPKEDSKEYLERILASRAPIEEIWTLDSGGNTTDFAMAVGSIDRISAGRS